MDFLKCLVTVHLMDLILNTLASPENRSKNLFSGMTLHTAEIILSLFGCLFSMGNGTNPSFATKFLSSRTQHEFYKFGHSPAGCPLVYIYNPWQLDIPWKWRFFAEAWNCR